MTPDGARPAADLIKLAEGREAEVFLRPDGTVLKLMRDAASEPRLRRERTALGVVRAHGQPAPRAQDIVGVGGRPGLVMERVSGPDLLTRLNSQPWQVLRTGTVMAQLHAAMHEVTAPESLPDLNRELRIRIEEAPGLPPRLGTAAIDVLATLPQGDRLCHGDLHPGNILGTWDAPTVIDWGDASRGDPIADVARTCLLHRLGELPPETPRAMRVIIPLGRRLLLRRYLTVYRTLRPVPADTLRQWEIVRAAARFREGLESEFAALTRFLEHALRRV